MLMRDYRWNRTTRLKSNLTEGRTASDLALDAESLRATNSVPVFKRYVQI